MYFLSNLCKIVRYIYIYIYLTILHKLDKKYIMYENNINITVHGNSFLYHKFLSVL